LLVALPQLFVKTARYLLPLCETEGLVSVRVVLVAPEMSLQVVPSVPFCHFTVGDVPLAAAVKEALAP
jgi:hypothetical protein